MLSCISASLLKNTSQGALLSSFVGRKFAKGQELLPLCRNIRLTDHKEVARGKIEINIISCSAGVSSQGFYLWRSTRVSTRAMASSTAARIVPVAVAKELLEAGHHYLDVRTPEEYAQGHPDGAVNIPFMYKEAQGMVKNDKFLSLVGEKFNKDDELLVACQSGKRSAMAAAELINAEYTNIADVDGGYSSWASSGLPVTK
eukprot:TRINITY_DN109_c0_g1_i1.p1 TRINITY_DN109_c0_g1~~TRINITY_DN109_c0_g1_i1.p1  ORF type:complete len:201 (-),score=32.94 TRINITY_DN109_c0_g1_i1:637-1239(-)